MSKPNNQLVISALGEDRPGIVNDLSHAIYQLGCSISDSRMTILGGEFAMLLLVEGPWNQLAKFEGQIKELEKKLGMTIVSRHTQRLPALGDKLPYSVEVVSLDHPGIVHKLSNFFSQRNINIEEFVTSTYSAAHTGTQMFSVELNISIPAQTKINELRDEFMEFCDTMNLDAVLEPLKK